MAFIGTISRALLERATAYYVGGTSITVLDASGAVIIGDTPPAAPSVVGTIADRVYEVGTGPYTINLAEKISGAASYVVSPANANLSLSGSTLTITPTATLNQTTISVTGRNGGGDSQALAFKLTINAVAPTLTVPLPDRNLGFGSANVTVPLDDFFAGVASYAVSPAANGATINGRNLVLSAAQVRSLDITVTGTNSTGQSLSDTFLFAVAQTTQAPSVQTPPSISGGTTVGSILTRTAGAATGIPAPSRATVWLRNDEIINGQTGNTLDTSGFAADDIITTRDVWTNTVNGEAQTATGTSDPWTLTVQPALTATPPALTAGQQASITFNTAIDGSPTVTQGGVSLMATRVGTTNEWTFTPATTQPVSISATKSGWTAYSVVIENVQAAAASLAVDPTPPAAPKRFRVDNFTTDSPDFTVSIDAPAELAGDYVITAADVVDLEDGPVYAGGADVTTLSGDPAAVGETLVVDAGAWWTHSSVTALFEFLDGATVLTGALGNRYTVPSGMAGKTIVPRITGTDLNGPRSILLTGVSIPALVVAITSNFNGTNGTYISDYSGSEDAGRTFDTYGVTGGLGAITDGFLHGTETNGIGTGTGFVYVSDDVSGGVYEVEMPSRTANGTPSGYDARGIWVAFGIKGLTTGFQVRYNIAAGQLLVEKFVSGTVSTVATKSSVVIAANSDYTLKVAVDEHPDEETEEPTATAVVSLNGAVVPELGFTDADLAGGKPGYRHFRGNVNTNKAAALTVTVGA